MQEEGAQAPADATGVTEDDVIDGNGVARLNVLSDDNDDFDIVQQLPAPADAKRKRPQKLAGGRKKSRK
jgi:hypothetical protein